MAKVERAEFRNTTSGYVGAVRLDNRGEARGVAVAPGESVWLGQEEQELTANAPRRPESNPSLPQPFEQRGPITGEVIEEGERAPLELVTEARPTPTSMPGAGCPAERQLRARRGDRHPGRRRRRRGWLIRSTSA